MLFKTETSLAATCYIFNELHSMYEIVLFCQVTIPALVAVDAHLTAKGELKAGDE